jgi:hypothetical protein
MSPRSILFKATLPFFICLLCATTAHAQLNMEVKTNPFVFPFGPMTIATEVGIKSQIGLELAAYFHPKKSTEIVYLVGKYYFKEDANIKGFHIGLFGGQYNDNTGLGFLVGHKFVSSHNIFMEVGAGVGRALNAGSDDIVLPYLRLDVGYHFSLGKSGTQK